MDKVSEFPSNDEVAEALKKLLAQRGNKPLEPSEAYKILADVFKLDIWQIRAERATTHEKNGTIFASRPEIIL